jgi:tetratricopeptide (TPR) repeat protein/serine/threonine protein kinase
VSTPGRDSIICAAIEITSAEERAAFIERSCGDDPKLRQQVQDLVDAHFRAGSFLEQPADGRNVTGPFLPAAGDATGTLSEGPGSRIGPYKLLQLLGEGGMGAVWMAEQSEPVRRRVAVKVIKPGMDSAQVVARFEAERQALALMDHPNIARVLDAGSTPQGRPFFVMELVKGTSITHYCDEHQLTPRQRLELFVPVCQAIQHAHQKGIIHRDVKPSNVLIAPYDGRAVVKVIDFGIAKAIGQQLTERTLFTVFGAVIGTPEYMSPEQAELNNQDIDTRTDVYSLGVLLYELLTGTPPLQREQLEKATFLEVLRLVREAETPRPSVRLSTTEALPQVAAKRGVEPGQLTKLIRGELDWIVLKALEKDRNRRYDSANGFAMDVQRYLADEPVQACPPSASYRLRKFVRKNRRALAVALVVFVAALSSAGAGIWWLMKQAELEHAEDVRRAVAEAEGREKRAATEREVGVAVQEAKGLQQQHRWKEALSSIRRAELLLAGNEGVAPSVAERVHRCQADLQMAQELEQIQMQAASDTFVEYRTRKKRPGRRPADAPLQIGGYVDSKPTREAFAKAFTEYGLDFATCSVPEAAERVQGSSIREELMGALDLWVAITPREAAERPKLDAVGMELWRQNPWRKEFAAASRARDREAVEKLVSSPETASLPAGTLSMVSNVLQSMDDFPRAVEALREAQRHAPDQFWVNVSLAFLLVQGQPAQWQEAAGYLRVAVALRPSTAMPHLLLGVALSEIGDVHGAAVEFAVAGELEPGNVSAHVNHGRMLITLSKPLEAEAAFRKALEADPNVAEGLTTLGVALMQQNKPTEALPLLQKAIRLGPDLAEAQLNMGKYYESEGKRDIAFGYYQQALGLDPKLPEAHNNVGACLMAQGKFEEALKHVQMAVELKPDYALAHLNYGNALQQLKQEAVAEGEWRNAIELDPNLADAHGNLGTMLARRGDYTKAIEYLRRAVGLNPANHLARQNLQEAEYQRRITEGMALATKQGKLAEAEAAFRKAVAINPMRWKAHFNLGLALFQQGKWPDAEASYKKVIELQPNDPFTYFCLAKCFLMQEKFADAEAAYRKATALKPDDAAAWIDLGLLVGSQEKFPEAEAAFRKVIQLAPRAAEGHHFLGKTLLDQGKPSEALPAIRKALELQPDRATAHCDLGHVLLELGQLTAARDAFRRGHQLGTGTPGWDLPSADWVKTSEHLVQLEGQLPGFLRREVQPRDNEERLLLADLCRTRKLHAAAARFYTEAFARDPKLAEDWKGAHRYRAACQAALAGTGVGDDAATRDDKERARLRRQALEWLRASLGAYRKTLTRLPKDKPAIAVQVQQWLTSPALAGARDPSSLAKLPEAERGDWQRLWDEVSALLQQARE